MFHTLSTMLPLNTVDSAFFFDKLVDHSPFCFIFHHFIDLMRTNKVHFAEKSSNLFVVFIVNFLHSAIMPNTNSIEMFERVLYWSGNI